MHYRSKKILSDKLFNQLWEFRQQHDKAWHGALVGNTKDNTQSVDEEVRKVHKHNFMTAEQFPEVCEVLADWGNKEYGYDNLIVKQFDYLLYLDGCHFRPHRDDEPNGKNRLFTTITLMYKSPTLQGGELLFKVSGKEIKPDLEVGQTVIFPSSWLHQCTEIIKGRREILAAWLRLPT